jgi:hypothetical protein
MSEFSDRPLVAGSILGLRSFRVTDDGVLTGVMQRQYRFKDGANEAQCANHEINVFIWSAMQRALRANLGLPSPVVEPRPHQVAGKSCTCGFYAYFDGSNDYNLYLVLESMVETRKPASGFTGIIEGTGVVTVGSRGFRAEKARLVALVVPEVGSIGRPWRALFWWAIGLWDLAAMALSIIDGHHWLGALNGLAAMIVALAGFYRWRRWQAQHRMARACVGLLAKVRRNYPDVPFYPSEKAALKAHPLTPPPPAEVTAPAEEQAS